MTFKPDYLCHPGCAAQDALAEQLEARKADADTIERLRELLTHAWNDGEVQNCEACGQWFRLEETHSMEEGGWICRGCANPASSPKATTPET